MSTRNRDREGGGPGVDGAPSRFVGPLAEIAEGARRVTVKLLGRRRTAAILFQTVDELYRFAKLALDEVKKRAPPAQAIACAAGCPHCCTRQVDVTAPEVLRIVAHAREDCSQEDFRRLSGKIVETSIRTHGLNHIQHFGTPCPLLRNRNCAVYGKRPLVCRSYTSYSWVACIRDHRTMRLAKSAPVGAHESDVYDAVQNGLLAGLDDVGLRPQMLELIAALRIAIETPDAAERWLAGDPLFDPALASGA